jgi:hypothetical protein
MLRQVARSPRTNREDRCGESRANVGADGGARRPWRVITPSRVMSCEGAPHAWRCLAQLRCPAGTAWPCARIDSRHAASRDGRCISKTTRLFVVMVIRRARPLKPHKALLRQRSTSTQRIPRTHRGCLTAVTPAGSITTATSPGVPSRDCSASTVDR